MCLRAALYDAATQSRFLQDDLAVSTMSLNTALEGRVAEPMVASSAAPTCSPSLHSPPLHPQPPPTPHPRGPRMGPANAKFIPSQELVRNSALDTAAVAAACKRACAGAPSGVAAFQRTWRELVLGHRTLHKCQRLPHSSCVTTASQRRNCCTVA